MVGGCNSGADDYNIGDYNSSGSYDGYGYTMVAYSALHKQLCWEFGVSLNCVCIISKGPLTYIATCLETLYSQQIVLFSYLVSF